VILSVNASCVIGSNPPLCSSEPMPKMKSNRAAARRFSFTASGLVKRAKAGARHILTKKSSKRKRRLAQNGVLGDCDAGHVRKMLPYGAR